MNFKLTEVHSESEFDEIWPVHFQAYQTPYNALSKFFNPVHTTFQAAIDASKARHVKMWRENEGCYWVKVSEAGKVVGAACWISRLEQPSSPTKTAPFNAYWHIKGSAEKAFTERLISGIRSFVSEKVQTPHIELSQMIVHPDSRIHGVGRMLIEWGTGKASEYGVDTIVVSVPFAVPVYEKCGFGMLEQLSIDFTVSNPSETWEKYQAEDLRVFLMWKPVGRSFEIGDTFPSTSEL